MPLATTLPIDIAASLATFTDLADVAQLGAANRSTCDTFWRPQQVWGELSIARGLPAEGMSAELFRHMFFRINAGRPEALLEQARNGRAPSREILKEAAHMLRGLMPQDGQSALSCVLESAADAIWAHEVSKDHESPVIESLLQVARRRNDLLSTWQLEHLEDSYAASSSLEASMTLSMAQAYGELPAVQAEALGYWPDTPLDNYYYGESTNEVDLIT